MKKMNILQFSKQKKTIDLIKQMESIQVQHHRNKLKKLLIERKSKLKELLGHKDIEQPNFSYLKKNSGSFSFIEPNAAREPFVSQKIKTRNRTSERAFSSSPNMKVGNPATEIHNKQYVQNKIIINNKFKEYDRILDEQSGLRKIQALQTKKENKIYAYSRKRKTQMKKTFFQKIIIDKYNFYNVNQYSSIRSGSLTISKTNTEVTPYAKALWKPKSLATLQTSDYRDYSILSNSSVQKSRAGKEKLADFDLKKRQVMIRSRIKTQGSQLLPISYKKNLNSLND